MKFQRKYFSRCLLVLGLLVFLVAFSACSSEDANHLFQQGVDAMEAEKPDEAIIWFKKALQENPEMAFAHFKLGEVYRKKGDARQAYAEFSRAIQQDPQLAEARKDLAFLLVENRALEQVLEVCKEYLEINGNDPDIYLILANALAYTKDIDKAVKVLEDGRKIYPENILFPMNLAKMLVVQGNVDEGRTMLETLASEQQEDINVQLALVQLYEKIERYDLAVLVLEESRKRFPSSALPYLSLAQLSLKKGQPVKAKEILFEAEQSGINDSAVYRMIAMIEHRLGDSETALKYFSKAVDVATESTRQMSLMILADYHTFLKQYKEAQKLLETIIAEDSSKKQLKSKVVELFMAQGEYDQARSSVDALLKEDSSDARGHFLKGLMMMQDKDVAEAREEFSKAKELAPNAAENQFLYGLTFMNESEQISITEISEALKKNPNLMKARMALAELYARSGEYQQSLDELDKIIGKQGEKDKLKQLQGKQTDSVKVRVLRLIVLLKMGKHDVALEDAQLLVEQQPDVPSHKYRLAEIYYSLKRFDAALPLYIQLQEEKPESVQLLNRIVGVHMLQKKHEKALAVVDVFLAKYPEDSAAKMVKAKIYLAQEDFNLAEDLLLLEAAKGEDVAPMAMLAALYMKKNETAKAVEYLRKAHELVPENVGIMMKLADLYLKEGNNEKAISSYENVLKQKDDFLPAMNNLAFLYTEEGRNLDRALELANIVTRKLPNNPDVLDTLGWIYVMKGAYNQADPYLQQAVTALPDNPSILYHMGMLRVGQKQPVQAEEFFYSAIAKGLKGKELQGANEALVRLDVSRKKVQAAKTEMRNGNTSKSMSMFEEILEIDGFNSEVAANLAVLYAEQGTDITKALDLAKKAYDLHPANPEIADALGWVYFHQGSQLMAKQYLEKAIENDAEYAPARIHLDAVLAKEKE